MTCDGASRPLTQSMSEAAKSSLRIEVQVWVDETRCTEEAVPQQGVHRLVNDRRLYQCAQ
jgi:hypothetical protein